MMLSVWRLALLVQQVDHSCAVLALRVIEFRGYPLLVGLRRKGRGREVMREGQTSGDRATEKQCLLHFSRRFTVLDLVKLKAFTTSLINLNTFLPGAISPYG